jgi:Putative zinc-finger
LKAHVAQRLSQYLDGEIAAYERDVIVAHLRECAECARRLEELTAVDDMARSLTVEVPKGYFDTFASRVRSQLRAPAKHHPAPPVWSFAAAAALLVGVLTPILWHGAKTQPEIADRGAAPAVASSRTGTPAPPPTSMVADESLRPQAEEAKAVPKDTRTPPALEKRAANEDEAAASARQAAPARRDAPAPAASAPGFAGAPSESREADALKAQSAEAAPRPEAPAASARSAFREQGAAAGRVTANAAPAGGAPELRYRALLAQKVATAAQARSLREAWGAYVESDPAGPHADEARVSKIEAGMLAYRLSGEAGDREVATLDAAEYLARPDARLAGRVRALLASIQSH